MEVCATMRCFCWERSDAMLLTEPLTEDLTDWTIESACCKDSLVSDYLADSGLKLVLAPLAEPCA